MQSVSRLTELFLPTHYELSVALFRPNRAFSGTVTIEGVSLTDENIIKLHAKELVIGSITVDGKDASFSHGQHDEVTITHDDITAGTHIIVVAFSGTITDNMNGIYPCYYEINGVKQELLATQFESHYARQAFPCIDEPEAKATFDVTLTTEKEVTVLGNMPIKTQTETESALVTTFETTPKMSSYLLAWVIGDLQKKTAATKSGIEVGVWSTKAHPEDNLDFALDIAVRTIDFFEEFFDTPYPLPKSDHVALPDFSAGAMENWGLITYREIVLLADPVSTSVSAKHSVAAVIAHELAHQWFGNLVTMKWWNDLWLNESFANMMEYVAIDAIEPDWNIWLDHANSEVLSALRRDSIEGVQPIRVDVTHPDEISTVFDPSIVYAKGGRLLRMLQAYVGSDDLRKGLKLYFERHAYTNTEADDLWDAIGSVSGKDIPALMNQWMSQSGYPVVHVKKISDDTIELAQEQFFVGPHGDSEKLWTIPLHANDNDFPETLTEQQTSVLVRPKNTPLYLNTSGTAHFITHYDQPLYKNILANIEAFPVIDRLHFLHEQTLLAQAGIIPSAQLLSILSRYAHETEESVWGIMAVAINELKRFVTLESKAEKKLRSFVGSLSKAEYERLGWDMQPNESENDTKLRSLIISLTLYGENPDAIAEADKRFKETPIENLDPELRTSIMASVIQRSATPEIIDAFIKLHTTTHHSELRDDIAAALTSTRDPEVAKAFTVSMKDPTVIRPQDFTHWFAWLLRNRYTQKMMWQWTQDEWPWIAKTFSGDSYYDSFPRYIASALTTKEQLAEYAAFFESYKEEVALRRNISIGITELTGKVALIERDKAAVEQALLAL